MPLEDADAALPGATGFAPDVTPRLLVASGAILADPPDEEDS